MGKTRIEECRVKSDVRTPLSGAWQGDALAYELGVGVGWETKINTLRVKNSCARSIAVAKFHRETEGG